MTASAAARRNGALGAGPPSWKISSTVVSIFLTRTSGMNQAPGLSIRPFKTQLCARDSGFFVQMQRRGMNQPFCHQFLRDHHSSPQGAVSLLRGELAYTLRHQQFAQVAVGCKAARWRANY